MTDPYTGDSETIQVCETGPNTGMFANWAGACNRATWLDVNQNFTKDLAEISNLRGWISGLIPTPSTSAATWTLRYVDATGTANDGWDVYRNGVLQNLLAGRLKPGTSGATYSNSELSLRLFHDSPVNNDSIQFCLNPPLPTSSTSTATGVLQMQPGNTIFALYPNASNVQTSDSALVLGGSSDPCSTRSAAYLSRKEGKVTELFQVAATTATSDTLWATVFDPARNTNTTTAQTVSVTVSSRLTGDSETFTLTETGVNTGAFRNTAAMLLKLFDGAVTANDGTLEVGDADTLTLTYTNSCGAVQTDTASTDSAAGGTIAFTDSTGTLDGTHYLAGDAVFVKVADTTWSTCTGTLVATIVSCPVASFTTPPDACSAIRDSELVTMVQTSPTSGVFMNSTSLTAQAFASPSVFNDGILESSDGDRLIASYVDCNDGDTITTNNTKTDTAYFYEDTGIPSVGEIAVATRASLLGIRIDPSGLVEFATGSQKGTKSFQLYETDQLRGGVLAPLHDAPVLSPRPDSVLPLVYRVVTRPIDQPYLAIEETEVSGASRILATISVSDPRMAEAFERIALRLARTETTRRERRATTNKSGNEIPSPRGRKHKGSVSIQTAGAGVVQVPLSQIAAAGGPDRGAGLKLTSRGNSVPFDVFRTPAGPVLSFVAEPLRADYTNANTYVVSAGGRPNRFVGLTGERPAPSPGTIRIERTGVYASSAPLSADPFQWDLLVPVEDLGLWGGQGDPTWPYSWWWPEDGRFDLPALAGSSVGRALVHVNLLGASAHTHVVEAWLNGSFVGTVSFAGVQPAQLTGEMPASVLRTSGNQLELRYSSGTSGGYLYFDSIDIQAPWGPRATNATVLDLRFFDSSIPEAQGVEYLILTHSGFGDAAVAVAAAKEAEGRKTAIVDVENAYDRYTGGVPDPAAVLAAIREFREGGNLKYVLLVGDDTLDPTDEFGMGSRYFVPSLAAWTPEAGRFPSENRFADLDGDGSPDVAIGRLPVKTAEEANAVAAKIARQSYGAADASRHILAVDNGFLAKGSAVRFWLPAASQITVVNVGQGVGAAREAMFDGLREGAAFTHYFGHGGHSIWADEWLLSTHDIPALAGSPESVFFMWACQAQLYQYFWDDSLGEALLLLPQGGSSASFGPTGITSDQNQAILARSLYPKVFNEGLTLGEAIRQAKGVASSLDAGDVAEGFVLFGDPALIPHPRRD